jgi:hypothetical protein
VSDLTSLNLPLTRSEAKPVARRFEPLARNAFRTLGLTASASQREVFEAAASARLALKLGVRKSFETDAAWLEPVSRTEADVRDALGRLSDTAQRAFERIFWFHTEVKLQPIFSVVGLRGVVKELLAQGTPAARHDAALVALVGLERLDYALENADMWAHALNLWRTLVEGEEFWSLLVAADLNGEFEQPVTFGEVRKLRLRVPRLISAPVAEKARDSVARGRLRTCCRAFALLRGAGLPRALIEEYERDTLGPAEDHLEEDCNAVFNLSAHIAGATRAGDQDAAANYNSAWNKFESRIKPQLRYFVELGGAESPYVRRALERVAEKLKDLAERYRALGLQEQMRKLLFEARILAPPGSETLALIEAEMQVQGGDSTETWRAFGTYAEVLTRELAERRVPPVLPRVFDIPVERRTDNSSNSTSSGCSMSAVFWVVMLACCFALQRCGVMNTKRSTTFPPPSFNTNVNRGIIIPMPQYTPLPSVKLPPMSNLNLSNYNFNRPTTPPAPPRVTNTNPTVPNINMPRIDVPPVGGSGGGTSPPPQPKPTP